MTTSPFKFLDSYERGDISTFFGREHEADELFRRCFLSPILVVYGGSGTGKTSLVQCGLAAKFQESDWLPLPVRRSGDLLASVRDAISSATLTPSTSTDLGELTANLYLDHFKPIYFLFDQFEELFIFGRHEESAAFFSAIRQLLEKERNARVIFIVREEYLAELTRYERIIPGLIENRYRVERMARGQAVQVVDQLCAANGISCGPGFSEAMIDRLNPEGQGVELSYLQVYLDKLHRMAQERRATESLHFDAGMLNEAGSISDLLGGFLEEQVATMPDPSNALALLKAFVSSRGTKRQNTVEEARTHARTLGQDIPSNEVRDLVIRFVDRRILREKDDHERYELLHDALAAKIYESVTLVEKELLEVRQFVENAYANFQRRGHPLTSSDLEYLAPYEDKLFLSDDLAAFVDRCRVDVHSAQQLKRKVNLVSLLGLVLLVAATAYFFYARSTTSRANELGALALLAATEDPTYSYLLAEEANAVERTTITEKALINAFYNGPFASEFDGLDPTVSPDGRYIATIGPSTYGSYRMDHNGYYPDQDSTVSIRDREGRVVAVLAGHGGRVTDLGYFARSSHWFTVAEDSVLRFWDARGHLIETRRLESVPSPGGCAVMGDRLFYEHLSEDTLIWRLYTASGDLHWQWSCRPGLDRVIAFREIGHDRVVLVFADHLEVQDLKGGLMRSIPQPSVYWNPLFVDPGATTFSVMDEDRRSVTTYSSEGVPLRSASFNSAVPNGARFVRMCGSDGTYRIVSYLDPVANTHGIVIVDTTGRPVSRLPVSPSFRAEGSYTNGEDKEVVYADRVWRKGLLLNLTKTSFPPGGALQGATGLGVEWSTAYELSRGQPMAVQFDPLTGKLAYTFNGPTIISPNGEFSATLTDDHEVQVARLDTRLRQYIFRSPETLIMDRLLDDGSLLLRNGRKRVILVRNPTVEKRLPFDATAVSSYNISEHSHHVAAIRDDGEVDIWSEDGTRIGHIDTGREAAALWVKFAPDSAHVLVLKGDHGLGLYILKGASIAELHPLVDLRNSENVAAFSPDGRSFVHTAQDNSAHIVGVDGVQRMALRHRGSVLAVAWMSTGQVVTASADSTLAFWNVSDGRATMVHQVRRNGHITSVEAVPDKPYVLATCSDSSWFIASTRGEVVSDSRDQADLRTRKPITHARFSPKREFMITEFRSVLRDTMMSENLVTGEFQMQVNEHASRTLSQLITPDRMVIVDQEEDYGYIGISPLNDQNVTCEDETDGDIRLSRGYTRLLTLKGCRARFSPDGRYLYYIDEAERLRRVVADPDQVRNLVRKEKVFGPIRSLRPEEREDVGL